MPEPNNGLNVTPAVRGAKARGLASRHRTATDRVVRTSREPESVRGPLMSARTNDGRKRVSRRRRYSYHFPDGVQSAASGRFRLHGFRTSAIVVIIIIIIVTTVGFTRPLPGGNFGDQRKRHRVAVVCNKTHGRINVPKKYIANVTPPIGHSDVNAGIVSYARRDALYYYRECQKRSGA